LGFWKIIAITTLVVMRDFGTNRTLLFDSFIIVWIHYL